MGYTLHHNLIAQKNDIWYDHAQSWFCLSIRQYYTYYTWDRNSPITISYFNNLFPQKDVSEAAQSKHNDFDPLSGINTHKQQISTFLRLLLGPRRGSSYKRR